MRLNAQLRRERNALSRYGAWILRYVPRHQFPPCPYGARFVMKWQGDVQGGQW